MKVSDTSEDTVIDVVEQFDYSTQMKTISHGGEK